MVINSFSYRKTSLLNCILFIQIYDFRKLNLVGFGRKKHESLNYSYLIFCVESMEKLVNHFKQRMFKIHKLIFRDDEMHNFVT